MKLQKEISPENIFVEERLTLPKNPSILIYIFII